MKPTIPARLLLLVLIALSPATSFAQRGSKKAPVGNNVKFDALPPDVPTAAPSADFPLRVHLFSMTYGGTDATYRGYGSGNIVSTTPVLGFEYTFDCAQPFTANPKPEATYAARWKEPNLKLELQMTPADASRTDTCVIGILPRPEPFDQLKSHVIADGPEIHLKSPWNPPDYITFTANPEYPVRYRPYRVSHLVYGHGAHGHTNGMILGDPSRKVDFHYEGCFRSFKPVSQNFDFYQAKWIKPDKELEILTQEPGTGNIHTCRLTATTD